MINSIFRGFGSGFGRALGRIFALLVIGLIALLFLQKNDIDLSKINPLRMFLLNVNAMEQTGDFQMTTPYDSPCGSGASGYCAIQTNQSVYTRSLNTTYNGVLQCINFEVNYTFNSNYQYNLYLEGMSTDFRNNSLNHYVYGYHNSPSQTNVISTTLKFISKSKLQISFPKGLSYSHYPITICGSPLTGVSNYGIKKAYLKYDDGTQDIGGVIENNNTNTQNIIENNNSNTQDIINALDKTSYSICSKGKQYFLIGSDKSYIASQGTGQINPNDNYFVSSPLRIEPNKSYTLNIRNATGIQYGFYCFYNSNNTLISCIKFTDSTTTSYTFTSPNDSYYFITTLYRNNDVILNAYLEGRNANICVYDGYDNAIISQKNNISLNDLNNEQKDTNDLLSDSSIDSDLGNSFFEDFEDEDFGLSGILTLPLTTIQSLTSKTCTALQIPIPFTDNKKITLPCMTAIYEEHFGAIYDIYKVVSFGIISYFICINIFAMVKGFKDPDNDKVEVMEL